MYVMREKDTLIELRIISTQRNNFRTRVKVSFLGRYL